MNRFNNIIEILNDLNARIGEDVEIAKQIAVINNNILAEVKMFEIDIEKKIIELEGNIRTFLNYRKTSLNEIKDKQ